MALEPIPLPADVTDYIRAIFEQAYQRSAHRLDDAPTIHEETLDLTLITELLDGVGPHVTRSQTVVDIDVHFIGGCRHWGTWEVADIGLLINFRHVHRLLRSKVVLLQSKRLYPREADFVEEHSVVRCPGDLNYFRTPANFAVLQPRTFQFDPQCRYNALQVGDEQWQAIKSYEDEYKIPVHYLLYHPGQIPCQSVFPIMVAAPAPKPATVGARVMPAGELRTLLQDSPRNHAPSYAELAGPRGAPGIKLPDFIIEEVLACRAGYVTKNFDGDPGIQRVFAERGAPIAAAILIDIDLPEAVSIEAQ